MNITAHLLSCKLDRQMIFNKISFQIASGELIFILGQSGIGKSVLLKTLTGFVQPFEGQILVGNNPIIGFTPEELLKFRRTCGLVLQQPALFDFLTVEENICFGIRHLPISLQKEKLLQLLQYIHLPLAVLDTPIHDLSYGLQKRISIARTLAVEPKVILFDEPTTGLDPMSTHQINELIAELNKTLHITTLVVSHDVPAAIRYADRIFFLDQQQFIAQQPPEVFLKNTHPLIQEFLKETL